MTTTSQKTVTRTKPKRLRASCDSGLSRLTMAAPRLKQTVMNFEFSTLQEIAQHAVDKLNDGIGVDIYGCDLHDELFNRDYYDYYIMGCWAAEQWLIKNGGVFANIGIIKEYEADNFGEVTTDLSEPERVVNMVVYIAGEVVLSKCEHLQERWDEKLTAIDIEHIVSELKEAFDL